MADITALTTENFETDVLRNAGVYAVRFWAEWCGPCRTMQPVFQTVADELADRAGFGEVDIDAAPELAGAFGVRSIPTVMLFKDGKPVDQLVGIGARSDYVAAIEKRLAD